MSKINSLNLRKGIELGVEVVEIFKIDLMPTGDVLARDIFQIGAEKFFIDNPEIDKTFLITGGLTYSTKKQEFKISNTLKAYVCEYYSINLEPTEDDDVSDIIADRFIEIEFLNTKILSFEEFCKNIMIAQSFAGKHEKSIFKFSFIGYGEFTLEQYEAIHTIVAYSSVHLIDFYIKHKNIVSGVGSFITGLYRSDIFKQTEYFTSKELNALLDESELLFELISSSLF